MGILDDAIRQHLELKQRLGADDDELKRLEDEAFGPPTRPGEPDFPEAEAEEEVEVEDEAEVEEAPAEPAEADAETEDDVEEMPEEAVAEPVAEGAADERIAVSEGPDALEGEEPPGSGAFFDQSLSEELDLSDLDLDLDLADEDDEPPPPAAAPIESLETEEHALEEFEDEDLEELEADGLGEEDDDSEEVDDEGEEVEGEPTAERAADEDDEDDEDVLADTPEFLRDAPEDDELWFEQGKPKDFDFDE